MIRGALLSVLVAASMPPPGIGAARAENFEDVVRRHPPVPLTDLPQTALPGAMARVPPPLSPQPAPPPARFDLMQYQTPAGDQASRGSCQAYAFVGALEALYRRAYGFTLDLSEEYLIHITHSTPPPGVAIQGEIRTVTEGMMIPEERDAPTLTLSTYLSIGLQHGYYVLTRNNKVVDNPARSQAQIDGFRYDDRIIPLSARHRAAYGALKLFALDSASSRDTDLLEAIIASGREVSIGMSWWQVDCGPANKSNAAFVFDDGNYRCLEGQVNANNGPPEDYEHQVLLVGYDRNQEFFLAKNSYGSTFDFVWLPYSLIERTGSSAIVVLSVRNPLLGPSLEAFWIGPWRVLADDGSDHSDLVIRRTRPYSDPRLTFPTTFFDDNTKGQPAVLGSHLRDGSSDDVSGRVQDEAILFSQDLWQAAGVGRSFELVSTRPKERAYGVCAVGVVLGEGGEEHRAFLVRPGREGLCPRPRSFAWLGASLSVLR